MNKGRCNQPNGRRRQRTLIAGTCPEQYSAAQHFEKVFSLFGLVVWSNKNEFALFRPWSDKSRQWRLASRLTWTSYLLLCSKRNAFIKILFRENCLRKSQQIRQRQALFGPKRTTISDGLSALSGRDS